MGKTMRNSWLSEIRIKEIADEIGLFLTKQFVDTSPDTEKWSGIVEAYLETFHKNDDEVKDSILWRYTFKYGLDTNDQVKIIELVKLPWLI